MADESQYCGTYDIDKCKKWGGLRSNHKWDYLTEKRRVCVNCGRKEVYKFSNMDYRDKWRLEEHDWDNLTEKLRVCRNCGRREEFKFSAMVYRDDWILEEK